MNKQILTQLVRVTQLNLNCQLVLKVSGDNESIECTYSHLVNGIQKFETVQQRNLVRHAMQADSERLYAASVEHTIHPTVIALPYITIKTNS